MSGGIGIAGSLVECRKAIPVEFEGISFDEGFRADLMVENAVIVELKSVERIAPVHSKQLLTISDSWTIDWDC